MNNAQFDALLPIIVGAVVAKIVERDKLKEDEAISRLYASRIYEYLEKETTKVWQYSAEKLYSLFIDERNGNLELPE